MGKKIYDAVQISNNDEWKVRLQLAISPNDAHAITLDVKYHLPCYVKHVQHQPQQEPLNSHQVDQNQKTILANIEFINVIKNILHPGNIVSMNDATYNGIRRIHGVVEEEMMSNRHTKKMIKTHLENVAFSRPAARECEMLCSMTTKDSAIKKEINSQSTEHNTRNIFECATILRKDVLCGRESPSTGQLTVEIEMITFQLH